jgi:hypothetical protein
VPPINPTVPTTLAPTTSEPTTTLPTTTSLPESTVISPAPGAGGAAPPTGGVDIPTQQSSGGLFSVNMVYVAAGGLVLLSALMGWLTLLYWRHSQPLGGTGLSSPGGRLVAVPTSTSAAVPALATVDAAPVGNGAPVSGVSIAHPPVLPNPQISGQPPASPAVDGSD